MTLKNDDTLVWFAAVISFCIYDIIACHIAPYSTINYLNQFTSQTEFS